jgi:hypothetical protein
MMMVLEAHKQQQLQEQEHELEQRTAAAAGSAVVAGGRVSDAGAAAADARHHGVQHTSVNRFFAAADEAHAASGMPSRRSLEDATSAARGMQRSSYGSMEDSSR